jgi:signal transduction histidine kinase
MHTDTTLPKRRILLIDDNESIHQDFRKILNPPTAGRTALASAAAELFGDEPAEIEERGFEIDSAFQGQQGLEMVRQACAEERPYAMAFVDIRMPPGWDGIETIGRIWSEYADLQVVICTAYSDYSLDHIVRKLGRSDRVLILKKPFDAIEVLQFADALTEKWRLSQQVRAKMEDLETRVAERTRELLERQHQLIEARKMELVGKLAGGIAHDFNSILTAIIGHADLIRQVVPTGELPSQSAVEIGKSAACAAKLTHQLLAFSRKQMLKPERLDVNGAILGIAPALREAFGKGIEVVAEARAANPWARADASQLQEVLMSLAHNARDAMPHGGKLTLETADVTLDASQAEVPAGDYVMIAITDTGKGIPEAVKPHLFEPYFSTKAAGEGKGLGLAVCHGILKQSGGHIAATSESGRGSTFKLYLPRFQDGAAEQTVPPPAGSATPSERGTEVILLVEQNPALRGVAATVLESQGYIVRRAAGSREAMSIAGRLDRVDLLVADVAMEEMTGPELAKWLCSSRPLMKVLMASPFDEDQDSLAPDAGFLRKPYTPGSLSRTVRGTLDGNAFCAASASRDAA